MATSQRPSSAVARVEPSASALLNRAEMKVFATQTARDFIEARLPEGVRFDQVMSEVYSCIINNPELANCTPVSLINAVARACSWGLPIGLRVFIVPFKKGRGENQKVIATAILGYRGAAELVVAAGGARSISAMPFYANEKFEWEEGTSPFIKHVPIVDPKKRGALVGGYAVANLGASAPPKIKVMHRDEIDAIRQQHSKGWKTKWEGGNQVALPLEEILWYVEKTPILQLVKLLPSNPRLAKLVAKFEADEIALDDTEALPAGDRVDAPAQPEQPEKVPAAAARDDDDFKF